MSDPDVLQVSRPELEAIVKSAVRGALHEMGLDDQKDIYEIKNIVEAWRTIRTSAFQTVGKAITMFILGAIAAYFAVTNKWFL